MKEELLKGLNEEQIVKIKACKNQEEVLKIAKEEDIGLTDEQLEAVSGGVCTERCPKCNSDYIVGIRFNTKTYDGPLVKWEGSMCKSCGYTFNEKPALLISK